MEHVYVYDPTTGDPLSKVRGVGRYVRLLRDNFNEEVIFTDNIKSIPKNSTLLNPFFDILKPPLSLKRISDRQIAVIHDVIRLKYPNHFPMGIRAKLNSIVNMSLLSQYDTLITDSFHSQQDIMDIFHLSSSKVKVVHLALPTSFTSLTSFTQPKHKIPERFCMYVGDVTWNKNILHIAEAVKLAGIPCVFVGKAFTDRNHLNHAEKREFNAFIQRTAGDPLFIFPGYVADGELGWLYQHTICNIFVSRDEGFGYSYLEAAHHHTPSVLGDIDVFHEIAAESALYANINDPQKTAQEILSLSQDYKLRTMMGEKAYQRSRDFSQKLFAQKMSQILF